MQHDIADYQVIPGLQCPSTELYEEWLVYMQLSPSSVASSYQHFGRAWPNYTHCCRQLRWTLSGCLLHQSIVSGAFEGCLNGFK